MNEIIALAIIDITFGFIRQKDRAKQLLFLEFYQTRTCNTYNGNVKIIFIINFLGIVKYIYLSNEDSPLEVRTQSYYFKFSWLFLKSKL